MSKQPSLLPANLACHSNASWLLAIYKVGISQLVWEVIVPFASLFLPPSSQYAFLLPCFNTCLLCLP